MSILPGKSSAEKLSGNRLRGYDMKNGRTALEQFAIECKILADRVRAAEAARAIVRDQEAQDANIAGEKIQDSKIVPSMEPRRKPGS